jgi:hypothetical protein
VGHCRCCVHVGTRGLFVYLHAKPGWHVGTCQRKRRTVSHAGRPRHLPLARGAVAIYSLHCPGCARSCTFPSKGSLNCSSLIVPMGAVTYMRLSPYSLGLIGSNVTALLLPALFCHAIPISAFAVARCSCLTKCSLRVSPSKNQAERKVVQAGS